MPQRSGAYFECIACGEQFYRRPSHIKRGITKTCGKSECMSIAMSGANNPFWEHTHTDKTRKIISDVHRKKPGPKKGSKHTMEARAKITAAMKDRWTMNRDKMLSYSQRGLNQPRHELAEGPRHRVKFTDVQKRLWTESTCFYCGGFTDLVLDHIVPASCGGKNIKANTQTLCQPCNRWKMRFVDTPLYFAMLGRERGQT